MASVRVPWVLPIRQGADLFDQSQGRVPAIVRITLGIKPDTPREMLAYMQRASEKILEGYRGDLIAFYQTALAAHSLGIVPISARTLNLPGIQARYQNQSGVEILDVVIYPDDLTRSGGKSGLGEHWDFLRIDFTWHYPDPSKRNYVLALRGRINNVPAVMCDFNMREYLVYDPANELSPAFSPGPDPGWVGYSMAGASARAADTPDKNLYMTYTDGRVDSSNNGYLHVSYLIDLRHLPHTPLALDFHGYWYGNGIDGETTTLPIDVTYVLWQGPKPATNNGKIPKIGGDTAPSRNDDYPPPNPLFNTYIRGNLVHFQNTPDKPLTDVTAFNNIDVSGSWRGWFYYDFRTAYDSSGAAYQQRFVAWIVNEPRESDGVPTFLPRGEWPKYPPDDNTVNDLICLFTYASPSGERRGRLKQGVNVATIHYLDGTDDSAELGEHIGKITFDPYAPAGPNMQGVVTFKPA